MTTTDGFAPLASCRICGGANLAPVHELRFELEIDRGQDGELAAYSGRRLALQCCDACGLFITARLTGGASSPLAFNLQAYARR